MPAVLHLELTEPTPGELNLRFWMDHPNTATTRVLVAAEIADLLTDAEAHYYSPLPAKLQQTGQQLYRWLDGGERRLTQAIQAQAGVSPVLVLAIAMPPEHRLAHLPWEVLHDGRGFLVHAANPAVLPVRWQSAGPLPLTASNRPLQVCFMASSPQNVEPVLDYEHEEALILQATERTGLDLTVEESGSLEELGALITDYGPGFFDVLHLTGHARHDSAGQPVFALEDDEGNLREVQAHDLAQALAHRPPLVFLSGCRTGQNPAQGKALSLAQHLLAAGFRAVLGWGRPVGDGEASLAAQALYAALAGGLALPQALIQTHAALGQAKAQDWHLLRLFCAGDPPTAMVTSLRAKGRQKPVLRQVETEFLDPLTRLVKVATRAGFVGRRRLLQQSLRLLRQPPQGCLGLLLQGQGGRGKSSTAARLCDRLRRDFQRVVVFGRLEESRLIQAWEAELPETARQALRQPESAGGGALRHRLEAALQAVADSGQAEPLFVCDDFEQNQPGADQGDLQLDPEAARVLLALIEALAHARRGRLLITCRYTLPPPFAQELTVLDVPPLDATEQRKQNLRLDRKAARPEARSTEAASLLALAQQAADGNPKLFEWLHAVLEKPGLDPAAVLQQMTAVEERFREHILARHLIASLPEDSRHLLGRLLLLDLPIPLAAVQTLMPEIPAAALSPALHHAASLSLVDITTEEGEDHYRVPHQLAGGDPPLLPLPVDEEHRAACGRVGEALYQRWWVEAKGSTEAQCLQLIRLAADGGRTERLATLARAVSGVWLNQHRNPETAALLVPLLDLAGRQVQLVLNLARALRALGQGPEAGALFEEALARRQEFPERDQVGLLWYHTHRLRNQGGLDEVLRLCHEELLPLCRKLGLERETALTQGRIADVLEARGKVDEALRIRREEELPVYQRLGDVRSIAVTMGKIADLLASRGELDEALRIRREEELPVYQRLGEVRLIAVTMGQIADVLASRGELDEALRIRREEQLPVYERLGDARERAVTMGKIADVLDSRGEVDEALRIRREEQLPVYQRLGEVRERAVTMGRIADVLASRGELDEALRIRREEQLPVYQRLGDVRERAATMSKIANVLASRGELDEALRIRREETLPICESLGDVQGLIVERASLAILLLKRGHEADVREAVEHLVWAYQQAAQRGYREVGQIAGILRQIGLDVSKLVSGEAKGGEAPPTPGP